MGHTLWNHHGQWPCICESTQLPLQALPCPTHPHFRLQLPQRAHFDVHQALFKACNGDQSKWHQVATSIMWADRVTVCWHMGCSPYFAVTRTHPLLPPNITEATYLLPPLDAPLSTTALIKTWAIELQKHQLHLAMLASDGYAACIKAAMHFKQEHVATVMDFHFKLSDLVLIQNTAIEKSLNCKMCARYLGPLIIILCTRDSTYIIVELDGSVFDHLVTAFWVIPYFMCHHIDILPLNELIDIAACWLCKLEDSTATDPEDDSNDPTTDEESPLDPLDDDKDWGQSKF